MIVHRKEGWGLWKGRVLGVKCAADAWAKAELLWRVGSKVVCASNRNPPLPLSLQQDSQAFLPLSTASLLFSCCA